MSDPLSVVGGVGGTAVNVEELARIEGLTGDAAELFGLSARILAGAEPGVAAARELAPISGQLAVAAVRSAADVAADASRTAAGLAAAASAARREYEGAEQSVLALVNTVLAAAAGLTMPAGRVLGGPFPAPPAPDEALRPLAWALGVLPGSGSAVALREVRAAGPKAPSSDGRLNGAGGLLAGIDALYPASGGVAGSLEVRGYTRPDGARSWAVLIPGTQSLGAWGASPMDTATSVQEYVGAPSAMGAAVVAALGRAGVRRGEPVLLAGHSQGGLVAMRLAADPDFRQRYEVTSVLTAGSPTGHVPTPQGVSVLHLEHGGDVVPALDAAENPDVPERTTVRHPGSGGPDGPGSEEGGAHDATSYARTGALVDASDHPSVVEWRRGADAVMDPDAAVSRRVYVAERP